MPMSMEELAEAALRLPVDARASLADKIVESLDFEKADELQRLWLNEALRRRDEIDSGNVKPVPGPEVMAEIRRIAGT
jgi:putative addiction module component (TIGR02574 family)